MPIRVCTLLSLQATVMQSCCCFIVSFHEKGFYSSGLSLSFVFAKPVTVVQCLAACVHWTLRGIVGTASGFELCINACAHHIYYRRLVAFTQNMQICMALG